MPNLIEENEVEDEIDLIDEPVEKETPPDPNADLKAAVATLTRLEEERNAPKEEPEKELTDEQKAELWAIYDPKKDKKDFMKKFFRLNPDATDEEEAEASALFADMQKGIVRQAIKGSMNIHQAEMQKLRAEIEPLKKYYADAQARELRARFSEEYPDFADPKYNKILELADKHVAGRQFKSEAEYFKAVAETAAGAIQTERPDFVLGAVKKPTTKSTGLTARSPRLSSGSGSGAGASNEAKGKTEDPLDGIFEIPD